jgi:hypothetical protein
MFILLDLLFLKKFQFLTIQTIPLALICLKISARSNEIHSHLLFRLNILLLVVVPIYRDYSNSPHPNPLPQGERIQVGGKPSPHGEKGNHSL